MDEPGIQAAVGVAVGVIAGAIFTALSAGLDAAGEVRLRAIAEERGRLADLAQRAHARREEIRTRLRVAQLTALALTFAYVVALGPGALAGLGTLGAVGVAALAYAVLSEAAVAAIVRSAPEATLRLYRLFTPLEYVMAPLVAPLSLLGRVVGRLVPEPVSERDPGRLAELAVEHVLERGEEAGSIAEEQAQLLWNVLEFKNTVAREIMIPRTQIVAFEEATMLDSVLGSIIEHGHSRYPVYRRSIDNVEGVLYAKDLFRALRDGATFEGMKLGDVMRKPFFVSEGQKIEAVLREMQASRFHMAIVADEFGGVAGLLTLEDVVEEIVGEIQDEHDIDDPWLRDLGDGRLEVQAGVSLYDLEEFLGEPLQASEGDYDSLGGLVVQLAGRVPGPGETVRAGRFELTVVEGDDRHVSKIEVARAEPTERFLAS